MTVFVKSRVSLYYTVLNYYTKISISSAGVPAGGKIRECTRGPENNSKPANRRTLPYEIIESLLPMHGIIAASGGGCLQISQILQVH
jgi:hypothetical protein